MFSSIGLVPNYTSFFSNSALNEKFISRKTGKRNKTGKKLRVDKVNFYSTTKNLFSLDRSKSISAPSSRSLLLGALHSLRILRSSPVSSDSIIESIATNFITAFESKPSREYPYRLEITINYKDIDRTLSFLKSLLNPNYFISLPSCVFSHSIHQNLLLFAQIIAPAPQTNFSLDCLAYSLCAELIMRHVYIDGSSNCPLLTIHARNEFKAVVNYQNSIDIHDIPNIVAAVHRKLTPVDRNQIVTMMITYLFSSRSFKGNLLLNIPAVHYGPKNIDNAFNLILRAHIMETDAVVTPDMSRITGTPLYSFLNLLSYTTMLDKFKTYCCANRMSAHQEEECHR